MSTFGPATIPCPNCDHTFEVELVHGVHITRLPWARQEILDNKFQVFECERCGHRIMATGSMVYTDFERRHYVAVESMAGVDLDEAIRRHKLIFDNSFMRGPSIAEDMGKEFSRRIVFGLSGLREKLLIWDAGLDDYVVEALKGDVLERWQLSPHEAELRVAQVLEGGHVIFARFPPREQPRREEGKPIVVPAFEPVDFETVATPAYRARAADRDGIAQKYTWLQPDWLVDISEGPVFHIT